MPSLREIFRFMRPYRWIVFIGFFTVILPVLMELVVPRALQYIVDQGIRQQNWTAVWQGAGFMLFAALIGASTTIGQGICRARLSQGMAYDMRLALFSHIQSLSFSNLDEMQTGRLMTRVTSDVDTVRMFSSAGLALLLRTSLMLVGSVVMMVITDWQLSLIMFGVLAISAVFLVYILRATRPLFGAVQRKLGALNTMVQENLAGVQVVKAFVRERFENERFGVYSDDFMNENIRVGRLMAFAMPVLLVLTNVGAGLIIWRGGLDVVAGRITVGQLIAFNSYLLIGMAPLLFLSNLLSMISRADASAERILDVLRTVPKLEVVDEPYDGTREITVEHTESAEKNGSSVSSALSAVQNNYSAGSVVFENVSFRYSASGRQGSDAKLNGRQTDADRYPEEVLENVSFTVEPGQRLALLGATGSGKSTLVNLIPRFYDVSEGSISVDGVDLRQWAPDALRRRIGVVLQQNMLFSGSVRDNIAYGRPNASMDDVIAAAQAAQAHDFIMAMPEQYESVVEARGANLSGGQKQRIAIARAILIKPSILILDDSTSAVDLDTEFRIQEALDELMANCTTFLVAQRINSVLNADQILVLERGRIAASGTHSELMHDSQIYQEIYQSQFGMTA